MIKQYFIAQGDSVDGFGKEVNQLIAEGMKPLGDMKIVYTGWNKNEETYDFEYMQVMISEVDIASHSDERVV